MRKISNRSNTDDFTDERCNLEANIFACVVNRCLYFIFPSFSFGSIRKKDTRRNRLVRVVHTLSGSFVLTLIRNVAIRASDFQIRKTGDDVGKPRKIESATWVFHHCIFFPFTLT